MRNSLAVVSLLAAISAASALWAQEGPSKLALYGGYDCVRFNINAKVNGQPPSQTFNGNGGDGELVYNVNNWLGVLGDLSGVWATNSGQSRSGDPLSVWAAGKPPPRPAYALRSSASGRGSDELRDRANWMAKPFCNDSRGGN